jgi:hypothetical protein
MTLDQYLDTINQRYKLGNATEHTFRGDLQTSTWRKFAQIG